MTDDYDLTPRERAELEALPRERMPGRLLEERTVAALRARGLLRRHGLQGGWVAAALAASIALFAAGFAAGQWATSRQVTSLVAQDQTAMHAAQAVQQAGSAYVAALIALSRYADSTRSPAVAQGREAAIAALYGAASELVRLAPSDPVARAIQSVLADADPRFRENGTRARNVVWF